MPVLDRVELGLVTGAEISLLVLAEHLVVKHGEDAFLVVAVFIRAKLAHEVQIVLVDGHDVVEIRGVERVGVRV